MKSITAVASVGLIAGAAFLIFVPTWTPTPTGTEIGFPQSIQFSSVKSSLPFNTPPAPLPAAATGGPSATEAYKNVQVLTDVSAAEFMRTQQAITQWVSPTQGCEFCHTGTDYASDAKPTKIAARTMMRMTRHLNTDWANHVAPSGVTCFSCHRGQPVPAELWFPQQPPPERALIGKEENWHESADTVRKFFPDSGYAEYYLQDQPIAVQSTDALPNGTISSQIVAVRIYEMMMQMSDGIGVNCGYCHNSRAIEDWSQSSPYRWNAWYALRLVRDLNLNFLSAVAGQVPETRQLKGETSLPVLPARQQGIQAGNGLVLCATCHYGLPKPMNGTNVIDAYPALKINAANPQ